MQLSPHFTLEELTTTSTGLPNAPPEAAVGRLRFGAVHVLQPWRDRVGRLRVGSGFRSAAVNDAVGGADDSQHLVGDAADLTPLDVDLSTTWRELVALVDEGAPVDQAIAYEDSPHIHVSWSQDAPRGELLVHTTADTFVSWDAYAGPLRTTEGPPPCRP